MSDHDAAPDPIDKAYAEAEAVLSDDDARAARRARLLAAVAREPVAAPAAAASAALPPKRRSIWGRGGWLAAASVAGLGAFVATQVYRPVPHLPATPAAPAAAVSATQGPVSPEPSAQAHSPPPPSKSAATPPAAPSAQPPDSPLAALPPPPPLALPPPPPLAFPAAPEPPPPVVPEQRDAPAAEASEAGGLAAGPDDEKVDAQATARSNARRAPPAAFAAGPGAAPPTDLAVRLRAAADDGRITELKAVLAQGVPVDAPDAQGETALMKSIEADHPDAAALLRHHGASLDSENHAGESARDMAAAKDDAALDRALGLGP